MITHKNVGLRKDRDFKVTKVTKQKVLRYGVASGGRRERALSVQPISKWLLPVPLVGQTWRTELEDKESFTVRNQDFKTLLRQLQGGMNRK